MGRTNQLNIVAGLLVAIGCLAVFVPLAPNFPANNLDSGWGFALNAAVAKGLIFGRDIALTYGPYASVATAQYHPATDMRMIWSSCLLAMAFAGGLIILARDRHVLLALLLVPLLGLIQYYSIDPLFFCFPLVFILIACRIAMPATHSARIPVTASVRFGLALLVIALSLLPLIKGTSVITCVAMGALAWALLMVRGQKMLAMSGVLLFVAGISAFWVGAGQPLTELPTFFFSQGQFVSGYTDAMSFLGPGWEPIIYIVACCLLGLFYLGLLRSTGLSGIALAVGIALLLFMAFKSGFVRHDGHALIAAGFLGLVGWILMIGLPGGRPVLAIAVCFITWAIITNNYNQLSISVIKDRIVAAFFQSANGLVARIEANGDLRKKFDESLRTISAELPLPPLKGTTDIYSFGQSALLANGLEWAPRPVFQSYTAYTPALLEKNAAHLANETAPDNILFTVQPIDGRLASLDDGLSWLSLLTRYEPAALIGGTDTIVLRLRRESPVGEILTDSPVASGTYRLGEEILLPATSGALRAKVDIEPSILGKFFAAVYKLPQLQIEFQFWGLTIQRRYIAGMGKTGFLVSPLVLNTRDFLALKSPDRAKYFGFYLPKSMSISVLGGRGAQWLWSKELSVRVFGMNIPVQQQEPYTLQKR